MIGRAVIAQSGGPTRVINASLVGAIRAALKNRDTISELWGSLHGPEGLIKGNFIDLSAQNSRTLTRVSRTPSAALYSSRKKIGKDISEEEVFNALKKYNLRFFFYIGGNDSADNANTINEIAKKNGYELTCFHIPKTVDNDLRVNDHTPGFGSAARYVANVFAGDNYDNLSLGGVKLNIVMGRSAGFLTAASALARQKEGDAPHLIYVPEVPFEKEMFLRDLDSAMSKYGRAIIAISEGIEDKEGRPIAWDGKTLDSHGNPQFSGSSFLADELTRWVEESRITKRVRADTLGYAQRSYLETISEQDWKEAYTAGRETVRLAVSGYQSGSVAILRNPRKEYGYNLQLTSLESVAKTPRKMPLEFIKGTNDVTSEFIDYAKPLIGGPLPIRGELKMIRPYLS
ncbi:MAG: diphosphate--fructose-6-phosphate 1-phosphotransferase [archaeon]